jgi:acetyl esterase
MTTRGIQAVRGHLAKLPPANSLTIEQRRAQYDRAERVFPTPADVRIELVIAPDRPAEWLTPPGDSARTVVLYLHGGGYVIGSPRSHRHLAESIARASGIACLLPDYRLAPEHPFPAAVEDARAALRWACAHAGELGADPARIGVAGDSAGGNLAAVVSQLAARDDGPAPVLQLLIYPATDCSRRRRSRELFGEGLFLTDAHMNWFETSYLGSVGSANCHDPRASPLLASDLSGLAPAFVVTAGLDPLRDEGEDYADALRAAGTPVALRRFPGFIHGFISAAGISRACRDALVEIAGAARGMLGSPARAEVRAAAVEPTPTTA